LDIAVDHIAVMGVLECCSGLLDVRHCRVEGQTGARRVQLSQCPSWCIVHDEKWSPLLHGKIVYAHDMRMGQASEGLALREELFDLLVRQRDAQHFERRISFEIAMFAEVDLGEAASPKQAEEAIVA